MHSRQQTCHNENAASESLQEAGLTLSASYSHGLGFRERIKYCSLSFASRNFHCPESGHTRVCVSPSSLVTSIGGLEVYGAMDLCPFYRVFLSPSNLGFIDICVFVFSTACLPSPVPASPPVFSLPPPAPSLLPCPFSRAPSNYSTHSSTPSPLAPPASSFLCTLALSLSLSTHLPFFSSVAPCLPHPAPPYIRVSPSTDVHMRVHTFPPKLIYFFLPHTSHTVISCRFLLFLLRSGGRRLAW